MLHRFRRPNQIGSMQNVDIFPIMKWNADEVVAVEDIIELNCSRTTIVIERKSKTAHMFENQLIKHGPCVSGFRTRKFISGRLKMHRAGKKYLVRNRQRLIKSLG